SFFRQLLLFASPLLQYTFAHLGKRAQLSLLQCRNAHQVRAVPRFDRARPGARLEREHGSREIRTENASYGLLGFVPKFGFDQQPIAHIICSKRSVLLKQPPQCVRCVRTRVGATLGTEIDMPERNSGVASEALGTSLVEVLQFIF